MAQRQRWSLLLARPVSAGEAQRVSAALKQSIGVVVTWWALDRIEVVYDRTAINLSKIDVVLAALGCHLSAEPLDIFLRTSIRYFEGDDDVADRIPIVPNRRSS